MNLIVFIFNFSILFSSSFSDTIYENTNAEVFFLFFIGHAMWHVWYDFCRVCGVSVSNTRLIYNEIMEIVKEGLKDGE